MRLFRGQRNFYIAGFALFCLFIIKRVASLISDQGQLKIQLQTLKSQAERNAQFSVEQEKQTSENLLSGTKCICNEKQNISDCGDNQGMHVKEIIAELESQLEKLKKEAASKDRVAKDLAETKEAQIKELEVANLKLQSMCSMKEESHKDK